MAAKSTIPWKLGAYRSLLGAVPIRSPYSIVKSPTMTTPDHEKTARTLGDRFGSVSMDNRGHWAIEGSLHRILDDSDGWNEDKSRIRTGHGPENMTRLRRFAIDVIKMHGKPVTATPRKLHRTPRLLLDYLRMSANTRPKPAIA